MKARDILKMMALPMAAATMMLAVSCTRERLADPQDGVKVHSIPVSVDVTRAEADPSTKAVFNTETSTLSFSEGDMLSVTGTHETAGTFSGTLDYSGSGKFSGKIFTENEFTGTATDLLSTANPVEATLVPFGSHESGAFAPWMATADVSYLFGFNFIPEVCFAGTLAEAVELFSLEKAYAYKDGFSLSPENAVIEFTVNGVATGTHQVSVSDGTLTISGTVVVADTKASAPDPVPAATFAVAFPPDGKKNYLVSIEGYQDVGIENCELQAGTIYKAERTTKAVPAEDDCLKFTALKGGSSVALNNVEGNAPELEYSLDGSSWSIWNYSAIPLDKDEYVLFRGENANGFSRAVNISTNPEEQTLQFIYSQFVIEGQLAASGNVMSLIYDCPDLTEYCFYELFKDCAGLVSAPRLPAMTVPKSAYEKMFQGCSDLTATPDLPATTVGETGYESMFKDCINLTSVPASLPAKVVEATAYGFMFDGCTSLTKAPDILAEEVKAAGCMSMFHECTNLVKAPALPATTVGMLGYNNMFMGCSSLEESPELPAEVVNLYGVYGFMFQQCTKLKKITMLATTVQANAFPNWIAGVPSGGTFVMSKDANWSPDPSAANYVAGIVPDGWTVETK